MPLLLDEDYAKLEEMGCSFYEDEPQRFFVFTGYRLPEGVYTQSICDVLVVIPTNYNQAGNDMFWTHPRLKRVDGKAIPATLELGGGDNRHSQGKEFCRWSRHWNQGQVVWKAGNDDISTIQRRIEWALRNPDT